MSTETLHTCPTCHTNGFTARGLKAHKCDGKKRDHLAAPAGSSEQPAQAMEVVAAGPVSDDAAIGQQLTAQYKRAVSGMREVLIFGAMLMQVDVTVSARGHGGKFGNKGTGLKGWLETYAPEISRPTAYRFLGITKAVTEEYEGIVGPQIAKRFGLPELVLTPPDQLPERARLKQGELFDFISGTSQRSWLDQFRSDGREQNGGKRDRPNGTKRRTAAEKDFDDKEHRALEWYKFGFVSLRECALHPGDTWIHLPDEELANVADLAKRWAKEADEVCRARKIVPSKMATWQADITEGN